jgi:hypothetical protein
MTEEKEKTSAGQCLSKQEVIEPKGGGKAECSLIRLENSPTDTGAKLWEDVRM